MERILDAILLGLVQGLTEFLPISSSGHLAIFQEILGWEDPSQNIAFNVAVHIGSLGAVLVFVRREILDMLTRRPRHVLVLVVATLPIVVGGALGAKDLVEHLSSKLWAVGLCLMATGGILALAKRLPEGERESAALPLPRAVGVGIAQLFAVLPGISRSGSTLVAGLAAGLRREEAVRFSFLLAGPAIFGAGLLMVFDGSFSASVPVAPQLAGTAVSFAASLFAMKVMVGVVARRRLGWFALYVALVGAVAFAWALARGG